MERGRGLGVLLRVVGAGVGGVGVVGARGIGVVGRVSAARGGSLGLGLLGVGAGRVSVSARLLGVGRARLLGGVGAGSLVGGARLLSGVGAGGLVGRARLRSGVGTGGVRSVGAGGLGGVGALGARGGGLGLTAGGGSGLLSGAVRGSVGVDVAGDAGRYLLGLYRLLSVVALLRDIAWGFVGTYGGEAEHGQEEGGGVLHLCGVWSKDSNVYN